MDDFDPKVGNIQPISNGPQPMGVAIAVFLVLAGAVYDVVAAINYGLLVNVGATFMAAYTTIATVS